MIVTHLPMGRRKLSPGWLALALFLVLPDLIVGELSSRLVHGGQSSGDATRQIPGNCQLPCSDHGATAHSIVR